MLAPLSASVAVPVEMKYSNSVYHLYVVRTESRDELQKHLSDAGVGTGIHYPIPIHLQKAYASMGWKEGDYPETETAAKEILSLPMYAGLNENQLKHVTEAVAQFAGALAAK